MSTRIIYDKERMLYKNKTFFVNERDTTFDSTYDVFNPLTGKSVTFDLSHSTGSEWDPKTVWVYKNKELGLELHISQDPTITRLRANNYLNHKLKNNGTS